MLSIFSVMRTLAPRELIAIDSASIDFMAFYLFIYITLCKVPWFC